MAIFHVIADGFKLLKKKKKTVVLHNIFVETLFPFFDEVNKNSIYLKYKYKLPENTILPTQTFEWQYIV